MLHVSEYTDALHMQITELDVRLLLHLMCKLLLRCRDAAAEDPQTSFRLSQHRYEQAK